MAEDRELVESFIRELTVLSAQCRPDEPHLEKWCANYLKEQRWRYIEDFRLIARYLPRDSRIADIGAAPFQFTAALTRVGYKAFAVDVDPARFHGFLDTEGLQAVRCDIEREAIPLEAGSCDAVLLNEVFEHLRIDPVATLEEIARVLRVGGLLILSTPNAASLVARWGALCGRGIRVAQGSPYEEFSKLRSIGHMGHVREYTPPDVEEFLIATGFAIKAMHYRGHYGQTSRFHDLVVKCVPSLRQNFSVIAVKADRTETPASNADA